MIDSDHCCALTGSLAAVKIIMEIAGKEVLEHRDGQNHTPLILATIGGHGEVVNHLLAEGGECVCMYVCMYVCVCVCVPILTHMNIHGP